MASKQHWNLIEAFHQIFSKLTFLVGFRIDRKYRKLVKPKKYSKFVLFFSRLTQILCTVAILSFYADIWDHLFAKQVSSQDRHSTLYMLRSISILFTTLLTSALFPAMWILVHSPEVLVNMINPLKDIYQSMKGKELKLVIKHC